MSSIKGTVREMGSTSPFPTMKPFAVFPILVLFAATLAGCAAAAAQSSLPEFVPGILLRAGPTYTPKACDGIMTAVCNTCNQLKLCIDTTVDTNNPTQDCPTSAPYCSMSASPITGVCQKTPDTSIPECATAVPTFTCTGTGYFADANSCSTYYYCTGPAATPDVFNCPTGYVFSTKTNACAQSAAACPALTCKADNPDSVFQALPSNTQYYVYCMYDRTGATPKLTNTLVFSCGEGATYNPTTNKCEFKCPKDGLYANTAYPKQYYQCYLSGGKLVYKDMVCPMATQNFDVTAKRCVTPPASG